MHRSYMEHLNIYSLPYKTGKLNITNSIIKLCLFIKLINLICKTKRSPAVVYYNALQAQKVTISA